MTATMVVVLVESRHTNPIHQGLHVLERLRGAGVPVLGVLWPEGVESGVLSIEPPDLDSGATPYRWQP